MAKKTFSQIYLCESIETDPSYFSKRMFGGLAIYLHEKMMVIFTESPGDRSYRDQEYDFDIWNGVMVATSRDHHESLQSEFSELVQHPVLGKWLYLPMDSEKYESQAEEIFEAIARNDQRFGIVPGNKKRKSSKKKKTAKKSTKKSVKKRTSQSAKKTTKKVSAKKATTKKATDKKVTKKKTLAKKQAKKKVATKAVKKLTKKKRLSKKKVVSKKRVRRG